MSMKRSVKTGLNSLQEKFCQELAAGKEPTQAARDAGAKDPKTYAYKNKNRPQVKAYVAILQQAAQETIQQRFSYTAEESFFKLSQIQEKALQDKQYAPALKAEEMKGKLAGLYAPEEAGKPQDITITVKTSAELKKQ